VLVLTRLVYVALPAVLIHVLLSPERRARYGLGTVHITAPAVLMGLAAIAQFALNAAGVIVADEAIRWTGTVYGLLCLAALILALVPTPPITAEPAVAALEADEARDGAPTAAARAMLEAGRTDDALRILQGLKRRGGTSGAVHLLLGKGLLGKGLTDLAEEELLVAMAQTLGPDEQIQAAYLLGRICEGRRKYDDAVRLFHGILQKNLRYADTEARYRRLKAALAESS
jgi:hypothetical protein